MFRLHSLRSFTPQVPQATRKPPSGHVRPDRKLRAATAAGQADRARLARSRDVDEMTNMDVSVRFSFHSSIYSSPTSSPYSSSTSPYSSPNSSINSPLKCLFLHYLCLLFLLFLLPPLRPLPILISFSFSSSPISSSATKQRHPSRVDTWPSN